MKNYVGNRLSPWLGHLMVSRQETARPLLTPGEVMQLPPDDELVLVSGCPPIRARKARYFTDPELQARILPPPVLRASASIDDGREDGAGDWAGAVVRPASTASEDPANGGIRREPELPEHVDIAAASRPAVLEFDPPDDDADDEPQRLRLMQRSLTNVARQASMDTTDDMGM